MHRLTVKLRPCRHPRESGDPVVADLGPRFRGDDDGHRGDDDGNREDDDWESRG